ncbi:L-proline trans-4-hydroxylase-like [Halichondria panicea]|uniref:L-proline trans-4-hydroxylase-like n=1 Tax=Halichondria panicea TaxID=6063 RepID=UPI00312BC504
MSFEVSSEMKTAFNQDGYVIIRGLLTKQELSRLQPALEKDDGVVKHSYTVDDGHGRSSRMCLWNHPGNDITGMIGRCNKVAGTMSTLLGGEVYHYHTKLMMKEPHTGGSFVWHQDYGYWYNNGCLFPDMGTVFIAIDKCDQENGCLKVLRGSHLIGRIDHKRVGGQTGADMERVEHIKKVLPLEHVEMESGDALFFHSNLLHCSDQNHSARRRWAFLIAYNRVSNSPVIEHHHPQYTPLEMVADSAIMECPLEVDLKGKDFLEPDKDKTSWGRRVVS